jgi:alkylation response protein AidB-like acyl-CoA dehydrogenase
MDLSLSDEQKQLQDGAERFVRDKYTFENRRKIAATERGWLPENWAQFAELGWLGMAFSEEDGGYGGGPIETMIVMEQFGKGLVLEPFLPTVVLGGGMIAAAGSKEAVRFRLAGAPVALQSRRRVAQGHQGRRRLVALRPQGRGL